MANENNRLVVAYFISEDAAQAAAEELKRWDDADDDIKLGAIAILMVNPKNGELEAKKVGQRRTKGGALWGTAIGAAVGVLSGGIALIPGMILGAGGGAAVGAMSHKGVGMTDEDRAEMVESLSSGGAALAVMADDHEVAATEAQMVRSGGRVKAFAVPEETAAAITSAAVAQGEATAAVDVATLEEVGVVAEGEADTSTAETRAMAVDLSDLSPEQKVAVTALVATTRLNSEDAAKLRDAGIDKPSALLERAATPEGRQELADETGIEVAKILAAVKLLDLARVKGVGIKNASLLLAAGVDTVPELAQRNPKNLRAAVEKVNLSEDIVRDLPWEETVAGWIAQAKDMPRIITY